MGIFSKQSTVFGLDIGYETLKLVQIERNGSKVSLVGASEVPLNDRILERDRFKNKADTANLIKEAMRKAKPRSINAASIVSALPETFVFSKMIKMPKMTNPEYDKAILAEASTFLPIPVENVYLDFQILSNHPNEQFNDIMVAASPRKLVDDYLEMAKLADLDLVALETKPLAVGRALIHSGDKEGKLIIHIGTEFSRISVWDEGSIRLTSTVNTGKNQLFESLGIIGRDDTTVKAKINNENKKDIAIPMNNIVEETINNIKYHQNRDYKPKPISKIIICGSGVRIEGIDQYIESEIKIKTVLAEMKLGKEELDPEFIAAYGLALRKEGE